MSPTDAAQLKCEEALRMLAEYLDHELDGDGDARVAAHLHTCRSCYSRAEFERRLKDKLRALAVEPVDAAFESRIREMLALYMCGPGDTEHSKGGEPWS